MQNNNQLPRNIKMRNGKYYVNVVKKGVDHYGGTHYTLDEAKAALEALYRTLGINPKFKPPKKRTNHPANDSNLPFCDTKNKRVMTYTIDGKKVPKNRDLFNSNLPKGIYVSNADNKYQVYLCVDNKIKNYIGRYETLNEAIEAQKKEQTMYENNVAREKVMSNNVLDNEMNKIRKALEEKQEEVQFQPDIYIDRLIVVNIEEMMDTFDIVTITPYAVLDELHFKMNMLSTMNIRSLIGTFVVEDKSGCSFLVERINVEGKHLKYYVKYFGIKKK